MARERHDGVTRTEVSNLFSRNKKAREIDRALQALIDAGRLERPKIWDARSDRTLTVWRPAPDLARSCEAPALYSAQESPPGSGGEVPSVGCTQDESLMGLA